MVKRNFFLLCSILLIAGLPAWAQSAPAAQQDQQVSFVGMKLDELYRRFGPPQTVYAARGDENWQDDVVFVYSEGDFYVYRDRVWQIGIKSIYGMKIGDAKGVALLTLGEKAQDGGDYVLYSFSGGAWPLSLRVNVNADKISSIFVYRTDY